MSTSTKYSNPEVLARVSGLSLRARQVVEGSISGLHRSPFHGYSVEFAAYRQYAPGDDLRRLDWRVLARTGRLYVKEYEEESNLRATIVMDASASMRYGTKAMNKFDYGATLAASMATLLIGQQDPVGLALFDSEERSLIVPSATQSQLVRIVGELESAVPDRETDLGSVLKKLAEQIKQRGLIIIISDLLTDLETFFDGLQRLQYRGHEVLVFHVLDRDELELPFDSPVLFHDIEGTEELFAEPWAFNKAYQSAMQEFITEIRVGCGKRNVDYCLMTTDQDLCEALSYYLHARANSQHLRAEVTRRH